ncbi:MAG: YitT family protein [Firmicutes bacterium]|nr:YitT family protein [Bacillota bacterium]
MKREAKDKAKNLAIMVFSNILFAIAVTGFIRPHGIILGGATGLGLLITHYVNVKLSLVVMVINVILLAIAYIFMGRKFALSTLANSILYPAIMYVFETFIILGKLTEDPMLACVFSGVLMGIGIGMILKTGGSTGGTDVIAVAINKYTHWNLSVLLYMVDGVIMALQLMFSNREQVMLGIFLMALLTLTMNKIMIMGKTQAQLMIFTEKVDEVREKILGQEDAGATLFKIEKGYTGEESKAIMCMIPRRKVFDMCQMIQETDPTAFWTISEVNEVHGRGFSFERRV